MSVVWGPKDRLPPPDRLEQIAEAYGVPVYDVAVAYFVRRMQNTRDELTRYLAPNMAPMPDFEEQVRRAEAELAQPPPAAE